MRNIDHRFEDPDVFVDGILKDGAVARVRMQMRDGLPDRPLTHDEQMLRYFEHDGKRRQRLHVDAAADAPFALNRPGFRILKGGNHQQQDAIDIARQKVLDARRAYQDDLENAWRTPSTPTGAGEEGHPFATPQIGAACTRDGYAGTWQDDGDGGMVCVIARQDTGDSSNKTLAQLQRNHATVMDQVYRDHQTWLENQWKTK